MHKTHITLIRKTATIHWLDSQKQFPASLLTPAPVRVKLTQTHVRAQDSHTHTLTVSGWKLSSSSSSSTSTLSEMTTSFSSRMIVSRSSSASAMTTVHSPVTLHCDTSLWHSTGLIWSRSVATNLTHVANMACKHLWPTCVLSSVLFNPLQLIPHVLVWGPRSLAVRTVRAARTVAAGARRATSGVNRTCCHWSEEAAPLMPRSLASGCIHCVTRQQGETHTIPIAYKPFTVLFTIISWLWPKCFPYDGIS